jgi:integrase
MLKKTVDRYQHGSVRKVKRAQGFAWEFRYYVMEGSKRKPKVQTFDSAIYKTEKALRQHLESFVVKLNEKTEYAQSAGVTFGALLDRYIAEEMPQRKATKGGYLSIINSKLRPQWGSLLLSEIRPAQVHTWLQDLDLAPVTKGHIKSLMHKLFDLATLWEYLPLERRNPIEIVKVKNVTMRTNEVIVLSAEQFREIAPKLPEHVNMIAMAAACLGLRVSEILGLQWSDIDWEKQTVSIRRSAYRGAIDDTKNNSSKAKLPLHPTLATLLLAWKIKWSEREEEMQRRAALRKRKRPLKKNEFGWLFANPNTGMPYMSPSLQQRWIRPAGEAIGLEGLGFHSLRHSYRTWLDSAGVAPGVTKDLMRHSAISTTFNVYLSRVMPGAHIEDGGFNQDTTQYALFGTAEIGRKQLSERVAVFGLLDAVPAGNDGQTVFVQQGSQPFGDEEQVTFHQPHRNGFGDGGEGSDASRVGNRGLPTLPLLLRLRLGVIRDLLRTQAWGDAPGRLAPCIPCESRPCRCLRTRWLRW